MFEKKIFFLIYYLINLFYGCVGSSLLHGLLIVVASLVVGHGL